jgi:lysozyme family protein
VHSAIAGDIMKENWDQAYKWVRENEQGNDDDPLDHGGRTSRGITQREYNAWRHEQNKPPLDVWKAPEDDIKSIYHDEYWEPLSDTLPTAIDYMYFDMAVNAGPYRAAKLLQRALGVVEDGRIGPVTRQAIANSNKADLIRKYAAVKHNYYMSLHQPHFIRGWLNRNSEVENNALSMLRTGVRMPQVARR